MSDAIKSALIAAVIAGIVVATAGAGAPFFTTFVNMFGISSGAAAFVAFSAVMAFATTGLNMMLAPDPPQIASGNFGTKASTRDANAPRQVVYGRTRIGGTITQMESTGADNNKLSMFIVLAGHEIESLEKLFINDSEVVLNTNTTTATVSGETVHTVTNTEFTNTENDNNFGSGRLIRFTFHDGSQTAKDGLAQATLGSTAVPNTHKFTDCAYVYVEMIYDPELTSAVPQLSFEVKGKNIYDPRTSALSTTDLQRSNPALIIRDFLADTTYGLKATSDELNDTTNAGGFSSAANTCDQNVTLADGSSTETRYTCNGFTDMGADMNEFISAALSSMAGTLTYSNGKFNVFAGANQTASLTITDDDCLSDLTISKKNQAGSLYNTVKTIFTDKDNKYIGADAPILQNSTFLTQDTPSGEASANYVKTMEVRLPFTTSLTMAQRLQKIALEHQRQTTTLTGLFGLEFMKLQPKDYVNVTNTRLNFSSKLFEVVSVKLDVGQSGENTFLATRLDLKEIETSVYDFATNEYATPISVVAIQNKGATALQGVTGASRSQTATKEGVQTKINILVSWTARNDPSIIATEIQFKLSSESAYRSITAGPKTTSANIPNVAVGETYNIRLRNIGKNSEVSAFTTLSDLTIAAVTDAPSAPSSFSLSGNNPLLIGLSWTNPNNADLRAVKIYRKTNNTTPTDDTDLVETIYGEPNAKSVFSFGKHDGIDAGTTYYFWLRAINHSGVHSSFTSSVNGSFSNIGNSDVTDSSLQMGENAVSGSMGVTGVDITTHLSDDPTNISPDASLSGVLTSTYPWGPISGSSNMEIIRDFSFTTPKHQGGGSKTYLVESNFRPVGAFPSNSETAIAIAVYTTATDFPTVTPENSSRFVSTGNLSGATFISPLKLSLASETTYYVKIYGKFRNVSQTSAGQRGFGPLRIYVQGLSA